MNIDRNVVIGAVADFRILAREAGETDMATGPALRASQRLQDAIDADDASVTKPVPDFDNAVCPRCGETKDISYHAPQGDCRVCRPHGAAFIQDERLDHFHYQCPCGKRWADPVPA